jgi:hypothetical protein
MNGPDLPPPGSILSGIFAATNLDSEVQSPEDVGTKGDLARILESFRLE